MRKFCSFLLFTTLGLFLATAAIAQTTFSNTTPITINELLPKPAAASPYPGVITVSGLTGVISKVTVTLNGFTHQAPDDVDMLLVSPAGQKFIFWSDAGGVTPVSGITITLDDAAAIWLPDGPGLAPGTFRPANYFDADDPFAVPAPPGPYDNAPPLGPSTFASVFNGINPNGNWLLFIVDDGAGYSGSIPGGWSLTITTVLPQNLAATLTDNTTLKVKEGDEINYTAEIRNIRTFDVAAVQYNNTPDVKTTLVANSVQTSALARDDSYSFNTLTNNGNVLSNDFGLKNGAPHIKVASFGTTASNGATTTAGSAGTTDQGGTLTVNADGTFSYTPPSAFQGTDKFAYVATTEVSGLATDVGVVTITVTSDLSFTTTPVHPTCAAITDGSITVNASLGNGGYTYSNDDGATFQASNVFSGLAGGTYPMVVKDAMGYTQSADVILTSPAAITVSGSIPQLLYNTAMSAVTFTRTNGAGAPANPWSATGLPAGLSINPATGEVTGTPTATGSYNATITYTDANGCMGSASAAVSVAPKLLNDSYTAVGNTQLVSDGQSSPATPFTASATNILGNDASNTAITITAGTFTTANGGSITLDATGKFTYTPLNGSGTADSYTYTGTSNGVSSTATISLTVSNMVWYVNNTYAGGDGAANGSSHRPYTNVASAAGASAASQVIYVHTGAGNTTGNAALKEGQTLRGAGSALSVGALSIPAGTKPVLTGTVTLANSVTVDGFDMNTGTGTALSGSAATNVTVSIGNVTTSGAVNAVILGSTTGTVTIAGGTQTNSTGPTFSISGGPLSLTYSGHITQSANAAMVAVAGGHTGTITFQTGTLDATNGTGLQFDNADGAYNFNGTVTLHGGDAGIDVVNGSGGTFTFSAATSITSPGGTAFQVGGSSPAVTYNGHITQNTTGQRVVSIDNSSSNTILFQAGTLTGGSASTGILIANANGGNVTFSNGFTLGTSLSRMTSQAVTISKGAGNGLGTFQLGTMSIFTSGQSGLVATEIDGTINSTAGTIDATGARAIHIDGPAGLTTLGLTLTRVASTTAATNGITLSDANGSFTITGDAGSALNGSGGSIQNATGHGMALGNVQNISLDQMTIQTTGGSGISGTAVNGFSFTNGTISGSGDVLGESNISFNGNGDGTGNNISGALTITGNTLANAFTHGIDVGNNAGTISNAVISNNSFTSTNTTATSKGSAINLLLGGTAATVASLTKATISNNTIVNFPSGSGIRVIGGNPNSAGTAAIVGTANSGTDIVSITGNTIRGESATNRLGGHAIETAVSGKGQGNFDISSNGAATQLTNFAGSGIVLSAKGTVTVTGTILNNSMSGNNLNDAPGIAAIADQLLAATEAPNLAVTISNNTVQAVQGNGILAGAVNSTGSARLKIQNNTVIAPTAGTRPGIRVDSGTAGSGNTTVCLNISGNTSAGSGGSPGIGLRKAGTSTSVNVFGVNAMIATSTPGVENYINGLNPSGGGTILLSATSGFTNCTNN